MAGDISQIASLQQSIPLYQQLISFYLSLGITALSLFFLTRNLVLQAKLKFYITKYFFIRVAPFGESLYVHTILMSSNDSALIKNVYAKLVKKDGANKKYTLETQMVCEVTNQGLSGDYKMLSSSPLEILEKDKVNSRVYVFVISEYMNKIKELGYSLENFILNQRLQASTQNISAEQRKKMTLDLVNLQFELTNQVYDCLQIEEGEYELTMYMEYEKKVACLNYKRTVKVNNSLTFSVDATYKQSARDKILKYIKEASLQILKGSQLTAPLPQYVPPKIIEKTN